MPLTSLLVDEILKARREGSQGSGTDRTIRLAEKAAKSGAPVLIEGEPGTGGDSLARAIHDCSERRSRPFLRVHAGGAPDTLAAALFGVDRGAGARQPGLFTQAQGGTLLVQGVEDLPGEVQAALLRAIQDGEIEPHGAKRPQRVDVRVIATAHESLIDRVRQGRFREDLYYRLHVHPITLAPLRQRKNDIPALADALARRFAAEDGKAVAGLNDEALRLLQTYDWPGNLRQLENTLFRAVALFEDGSLTPAEFPQIAARLQGYAVEIPPLRAEAPRPIREVVRVEVRDPHCLPLVNDEGEMRRLDELEAEIIRFALGHYRGHMSAISRRLGIGRSTLYRKLKELGLEGETVEAA